METLDEFQSITTGYGRSPSLKYQTYYDLIINACVRYDRTKKANIAKRGHIYPTTFSQSNDNFIGQIPSKTPIGDPNMGIDTPSDEFCNINTNQSTPPISARHKLQPRLLRTNQNTKPTTFPKKPARLVADGHLTPEPVESIYSGVVSLRNLKLVIFLGKLNNLELWGADIGNAYLEAPTEEKLYIVAGPEFEDWEGYILTFSKALYGLKSSGKRWAEILHDIL